MFCIEDIRDGIVVQMILAISKTYLPFVRGQCGSELREKRLHLYSPGSISG